MLHNKMLRYDMLVFDIVILLLFFIHNYLWYIMMCHFATAKHRRSFLVLLGKATVNFFVRKPEEMH